jgi:hypothetical protein
VPEQPPRDTGDVDNDKIFPLPCRLFLNVLTVVCSSNLDATDSVRRICVEDTSCLSIREKPVFSGLDAIRPRIMPAKRNTEKNGEKSSTSKHLFEAQYRDPNPKSGSVGFVFGYHRQTGSKPF